MDKAVLREEDARGRAKAARSHLIKLRKDESVYKGAVGRLSQFVDGRLGDASLELRRAVEQLDRYAAAKPQVAPSTPPAAVRVRAHERAPKGENFFSGGGADDPETPVSGDAEAVEHARKRTPALHIRKAASLRAAPPALPKISSLAREILAPHRDLAVRVGRYDLLTTSLPDDESTPLYLERRDPAGPGDSGLARRPVCGRVPDRPVRGLRGGSAGEGPPRLDRSAGDCRSAPCSQPTMPGCFLAGRRARTGPVGSARRIADVP